MSLEVYVNKRAGACRCDGCEVRSAEVKYDLLQ